MIQLVPSLKSLILPTGAIETSHLLRHRLIVNMIESKNFDKEVKVSQQEGRLPNLSST